MKIIELRGTRHAVSYSMSTDASTGKEFFVPSSLSVIHPSRLDAYKLRDLQMGREVVKVFTDCGCFKCFVYELAIFFDDVATFTEKVQEATFVILKKLA